MPHDDTASDGVQSDGHSEWEKLSYDESHPDQRQDQQAASSKEKVGKDDESETFDYRNDDEKLHDVTDSVKEEDARYDYHDDEEAPSTESSFLSGEIEVTIRIRASEPRPVARVVPRVSKFDPRRTGRRIYC